MKKNPDNMKQMYMCFKNHDWNCKSDVLSLKPGAINEIIYMRLTSSLSTVCHPKSKKTVK